jgi:hypothetical protein
VVKVDSISFDIQPVREVGNGIVGFVGYPAEIRFTKYSNEKRTTLNGRHTLSTELSLELSELVAKIEHEITQSLTK